jgi:hypothetical protein
MRGLTLTIAGALAVTAACSNFRPHAGSTTTRPGIFDGQPGAPGSNGDIGGRGLPSRRPDAGTENTVAGADARRVCRASSRPNGWIAVAYVAGDGCAARTSADSSYSIAVLTRYFDLPVNAVLEVCADEPIPANWTLDATEAMPSDACPGVKGDRASTTRYIRRLH